MKKIYINFNIDESYFFKHYRVFDIGNNSDYFDIERTRNSFKDFVEKSIRPMLNIFSDISLTHKDKLKLNISITGVCLDMLEMFDFEDVIKDLKKLCDKGCIDFIVSNYYDSLSFIYSKEDFLYQVKKHEKKIKSTFDCTPIAFKNTRFFYNDEIANIVNSLGYNVILTDNKELQRYGKKLNLSVINNDSDISDLISVHFNDKQNPIWPINSEKFFKIIKQDTKEFTSLFFDTKTFGIKFTNSTGIFDFLRNIIISILDDKELELSFIKEFTVNDGKEMINIKNYKGSKDILNFNSNQIQQSAIRELYILEKQIIATENQNIIRRWRYLTHNSNFYDMMTNTEDFKENKYENPYNAYIYFMNALNDLIVNIKLNEKLKIKNN